MRRVLLVGGCLLLSGITVAQQPFLPADEIVGKAWFDVQKSVGGQALVEPKVPVVFGVTRMSLSGADMPTGLAQCEITKRAIGRDEKLQAYITITVLKCGEYEYGISEVLFEDGKR